MRFAKQVVVGAGLFAVLGLSLTGCGKGVAKINNEKLTQKEYFNRMEKMTITVNGQRQQVGSMVLRQLIEEKLRLQMAKKEGVEPTKEQIKKRVENLKRQRVYDRLKREGYTDEDIESDARFQQANFNLLTKGAAASDKELSEFYKKNTKMFSTPEGAELALVICFSKEKMDLARKLIKQDHEEFTAVSARHSDVPGLKSVQGRVGFHPTAPELDPTDRRLPAEIYTAAFKMKNGEYVLKPGQESEPGRSQGAWFMVKVLSRRGKEVKSPASVRDELEELVLMKKAEQMYGPGGRKQVQSPGIRYRNFIKESKGKINILRYKDMFKDMQDQVKKDEVNMRPPGGPSARQPSSR
jgi:parvulin-like peptidyl-prolyl isomerase